MQGFRELIELHVADQAVRDASRRQEALRSTLHELEQGLASAQAELDAAETELKALQGKRRAGEIEIEKLEDTRKKYRTQLMSAKTNEIYKTLISEINAAGKVIGEHETGVLEMMERIEVASAAVDVAKGKVKQAEALRKADDSKLAADIAVIEEERLAAQAKSDTIARKIPPNLLSQYRRIAVARDGRGMALARNMECTACRVGIRPQAWVNMLVKHELLICGGCTRFLYREELAPGGSGARHVRSTDEPAS